MIENQIELTIRCPYAQCVQSGIPVQIEVPQGVAEELSKQGCDDRVMSPLCGHIWNLTEEQKAFLLARSEANIGDTSSIQGPNEVSSLEPNP